MPKTVTSLTMEMLLMPAQANQLTTGRQCYSATLVVEEETFLDQLIVVLDK